MKTTVMILATALLFGAGCGGNKSGVMSQEDRLNEQLALADEQIAQEDVETSKMNAEESDSEKAEKFDKEQAKFELKRATLNASDCPNTFEPDQLKGYQPGEATVQLTFQNDGTVKSATVSSPYDGTNVGDCVLRAMNSVQVKLFSGEEVTVDWKVKLEAPKKKEAVKKEAVKK